MAKAYISTFKYVIKAKFEIQGIVEKHDIIGAVFGQCEGLLGEDLDLKELQQSGKIGRIEADFEIQMGKTIGSLTLPSSIDMVKTSMLAASIESVEKVGPYESKFEIETIEDTRAVKRSTLAERAKQLLQKLSLDMPQSQEIAEGIIEEKRTAEISDYGEEKLPAGPDIQTSESIIVVEGRADVVNLLKNNIKNVIGMNGAKISQAIIDLSRTKKITVFVDGDRGGDMIARQLIQMGNVEFVAKAPDGKEVEELVRKEILLSLERKIPASMYRFRDSEKNEYRTRQMARPSRSYGMEGGKRGERGSMHSGIRGRGMRGSFGRPRSRPDNGIRRDSYSNYESYPRTSFANYPSPASEMQSDASPEEMQKFGPVMQELKNSLKAKFLDEQNKTIKEVSVRDLLSEMKQTPNSKAVVFDGIVTKRLVDAAEQNNIPFLVGVKKGKIEENGKVKVVTIA